MRSFYHCGETANRCSASFLTLAAAAAALTLMACGAAGAANTITYQSAPLVMSGDRFGDQQIPANDDLYVGGLTDDGQIVFSAGTVSASRPELLLRWDGTTISSIAAPASGPASAYTGDVYWPSDVTIDRPIGMNAQGDVVFSADHRYGYNAWGTFMWSAATQRVTAIALKDMPATTGLAFVKPGSYGPAINRSREIAFVGLVKGPSGPNGWGLFLQQPNNILDRVCLNGQSLPSANGQAKAATDEYFTPSINDRGLIAFVTRPAGSSRHNAYMWQNGDTDALLLAGQTVEGGAKITDVGNASLNNHDASALIAATTDQGGTGRFGLYRVQNGQVRAVAAPGATMPGGGILRTIQNAYPEDDGEPQFGISAPNAAGQYAFTAMLTDGNQACYRLDPDGTLALVFQAYPTAAPVQIADVMHGIRMVQGSRPSLNNHGQVLLSVRPIGGHCTLMLLTPSQP